MNLGIIEPQYLTDEGEIQFIVNVEALSPTGWIENVDLHSEGSKCNIFKSENLDRLSVDVIYKFGAINAMN